MKNSIALLLVLCFIFITYVYTKQLYECKYVIGNNNDYNDDKNTKNKIKNVDNIHEKTDNYKYLFEDNNPWIGDNSIYFNKQKSKK